MFDHVTIRASDREAAARFYDTVLRTLGVERTGEGGDFVEWDDFSLAADGLPPTRGLHVAFVAPSREHVDAFWRAGVDAGFRSDGEPGPRPQYRDDYYGAFLLDVDGNSAEATHHGELRAVGRPGLAPEPRVLRHELVEGGRALDVRDADPEVVDVPAAAQLAVVGRLGAVAVGVEQERAVVVVPVLRPTGCRRLPVGGADRHVVEHRARRSRRGAASPPAAAASAPRRSPPA